MRTAVVVFCAVLTLGVSAAPAATPKPIIDKLYTAVTTVLTRPEMKQQLAKQMMTVSISPSPQQFSEEVRNETRAWSEVVSEHKVKID